MMRAEYIVYCASSWTNVHFWRVRILGNCDANIPTAAAVVLSSWSVRAGSPTASLWPQIPRGGRGGGHQRSATVIQQPPRPSNVYQIFFPLSKSMKRSFESKWSEKTRDKNADASWATAEPARIIWPNFISITALQLIIFVFPFPKGRRQWWLLGQKQSHKSQKDNRA